MKRKINLLLLLAACSLLKLNAQVTLYESFTAPFNPAASGWNVQNLSSAIGTNANGWIQGTSAKFDAIVGTPNDYYAADMNSTASAGATNTISCWLITPTVNLVNGAWYQFATQCSKLPAVKAERIQIYYSFGTGTNVGTTAGSATNTAGTFTNLVADYNPNMTANGFPTLWMALSNTLTGIATPTVGRIAIRYYIPNGGAGGPNGNYIGIDDFRYSLPCNRPVFFGDPVNNNPICVGVPTPFKIYQVGTSNPVNSYTWSNGATTSSTNIVPTTTGVVAHWTLGETTPGCQALDISLYMASAIPTISIAQTPTSNICAGNTLTVSTTGAASYTYVLGATSSSTQNPIVLTAPTVTNLTSTQFTVIGGNSGCVAKQTLTLAINPNPTLTVTSSKSVTCIKNTVTFTASGASTYSWSGAASSTLNIITYTAGTTAGVQQFTVVGISAAGCKSAGAATSVSVSLCSGIAGQEDYTATSVYPNPFQDQLTLKEFTGSAEIYSTQGQLLYELKSENTKVIDTSNFPAGIYILKTESRLGEKRSYRLIKN